MFSLLRILIRIVTWIVARGAVGLIILTAVVAAWPQSLHLYLEQLCPSGGQVYSLRDWRPQLAEEPEGFLPVCVGKGQIIDEAGERMLEIGVGAFLVALVSGVVFLGTAPRKATGGRTTPAPVQRSEATTRAGPAPAPAPTPAEPLSKPMQRMAQALRRQAEIAQAKSGASAPAPTPSAVQTGRSTQHSSPVQRVGDERGGSVVWGRKAQRSIVERS